LLLCAASLLTAIHYNTLQYTTNYNTLYTTTTHYTLQYTTLQYTTLQKIFSYIHFVDLPSTTTTTNALLNGSTSESTSQSTSAPSQHDIEPSTTSGLQSNGSSSSSSSAYSSSSISLPRSEPEPWRTSTSPKLPPGHLLDIPDDLLFDIFTIYMRLEDVCGLDSALCNKRRRAEFLELVSRKVLLFNRE
jgi:hypothetical protein